jgi:hypothetical protein
MFCPDREDTDEYKFEHNPDHEGYIEAIPNIRFGIADVSTETETLAVVWKMMNNFVAHAATQHSIAYSFSIEVQHDEKWRQDI